MERGIDMLVLLSRMLCFLVVQEYTPVVRVEVESDHLCGGELLLNVMELSIGWISRFFLL